MFEPYFTLFESWRDHALDKAKERLDDKQDAIILTMDFKRFYYSVDMQASDFQGFLQTVPGAPEWQTRVNDFIYKVICVYSGKLREYCANRQEWDIGNRNVLPIGFLPSNILSNWVLTKFDDAIIAKWNPVYYGRYVDDIIIVDKVEKNDPLYKRAREEDINDRLKSDDVIDIKLVNAGLFSSVDANPLLAASEDCINCSSLPKQNTIYKISNGILDSPLCEITVQSQKVKLFYIQSGATRALLDCFRSKIDQNANEFRMLPNYGFRTTAS